MNDLHQSRLKSRLWRALARHRTERSWPIADLTLFRNLTLRVERLQAEIARAEHRAAVL
ncbi:hypothetical protein [Phenylobacterium sp.]|uniref:hypothetical protein n=1 Tax=Phenylobacterium sp. TaxID=1871053 RepID=UPI002E30DAB7|nr:hypothetical protein [Phenylobacterium sp.]HEX2561735.1 hypothetical protein [Phenylobacterium sp.]